MEGLPYEGRSSGPHHSSLRKGNYRAAAITAPHALRHSDSIHFFANGDLRSLELPFGGSDTINRDCLCGEVVLDPLQVEPQSLTDRFRICLLDRPDEIEAGNGLVLWHIVT